MSIDIAIDATDAGSGQQCDDVSSQDGSVTRGWFSKEDESKALEVADAVIRGRHDFKQKLRGFLRKNHLGDHLPTTKEMLDDELALYDTDYDATRGQAIRALSYATKARKNYQLERRTGWKKVGHQAQAFVKTFADFMGVYSGIISLMKGAGQVYGEVAYETLSILFIVVVNKSANDSKIGRLLSELRKSFPQLDDWTSIYPTPDMKMLVTEVYTQVIEFARHASVYFTRFTTRLWMAIGNPPSRGIDKTATQVHKKLAEVSSGAMILLHKRSQSINDTVQDSSTRLKELQRHNNLLLDAYERIQAEYERFRSEVETEQENEDTQRLQRFREKLELSPIACPSASIQAYASTLQRAFPTSSSSPRKIQYQNMTEAFLKTIPPITAWTEAQTSSLLLLGGKTRPEARSSLGYTHSWLSPAAIYVATNTQEQGGKVAFYGCHAAVQAHADGKHSAREVVSSLVGQVIDWKPRVLRRKMVEWESRLNRLKDMEVKMEEGAEKGRERERMKALFEVLKEVLAAMREDTGDGSGHRVAASKTAEDIENSQDCKSNTDKMVYLVLDRVDLVPCSLRYFINELVELVNDERCLVKVLVVIDTAQWCWDLDSLNEQERVIAVPDLDQKRVGLLGGSKLPHADTL